jgi:hypothetical protein
MANTPAHQRGLLLYLLKAPDGKPGVSVAYMGRRYFAANKGVRVLRQGSGSHPDEASIVGSLRRRCYLALAGICSRVDAVAAQVGMRIRTRHPVLDRVAARSIVECCPNLRREGLAKTNLL